MNVVGEVILLGESVGVETAVLLDKESYFFRRVAGNGRKSWSSSGNVQGSGMLVQATRCLKPQIGQLFARSVAGKNPAQQSVNRDLRDRDSLPSKYVVVEVVLPAKYLGFSRKQVTQTLVQSGL